MRTLWTWQRSAGERAPGRPRHAPLLRWQALCAVGRVLRGSRRRRKCLGWRTVAQLVASLPTRAVQAATRAWKRRLAARHAQRIARARVHVEVHGRDVLWGQDATQVGRLGGGGRGSGVQSEVVRDLGSRRTLQSEAGRTRDGGQIVAGLAALKAVRGTLPLVWMTDNGSAYVGTEVARYLEAERVVHLRNAPYTPQHNAWTERANGELKQASGLTSATPLESIAAAQAALDAARTWLDEERPRAVLGGVTAAARDASLEPGYSLVDRDVLYAAARAAMATAVQDMPAGRARRMAEREAIWCTLERFGLIERTRGEARRRAVKSERDL